MWQQAPAAATFESVVATGEYPTRAPDDRGADDGLPRDTASLIEIGREYEAADDFVAAASVYRRGLAGAPDDGPLLLRLASCLRRQEDLSGAEVAARRYLEVAPSDYEAHRLLGNILISVGRTAEAEAAFRRALAIRPASVNAIFNLARSHRFAADEPEFAQLLAFDPAKSPRTDSQRSMLHFALGKAFDDVGDYERAFGHFSQANKIMADAKRYRPGAAASRVERIIETYDLTEIPHRSARSRQGVTPIFVTGLSRSGKSLLGTMLGRHRLVRHCFESRDLSEVVQSTVERAGIAGRYPNFVPSLHPRIRREIAGEYLGRYLPRMSPTERYFVTTTPGTIRYVGLILQCFPNARIVICRRDPLDQCLQMFFKRYTRGNVYARDLIWAGHYYRQRRRLDDYWDSRLGERIHFVSYETLVRQPLTVTKKLMRFCGLYGSGSDLLVEMDDREIGHWRNYSTHLDGLRASLAGEPAAG